MITIHHCRAARSLRPLWVLEEMGIPLLVEGLPFPPRARSRAFLDLNPFGTISFLVDGDVRMSESVGIAMYLERARAGPASPG